MSSDLAELAKEKKEFVNNFIVMRSNANNLSMRKESNNQLLNIKPDSECFCKQFIKPESKCKFVMKKHSNRQLLNIKK